MTEHVEQNATDDAGRPAPTGGRRFATALAAVVALTVAGGWAYDHRDEYGAAYTQLFDDEAGGCPSAGCPLAATASACCPSSGGCGEAPVLTALLPVEAPKPAVVLSEADPALASPTSL